MTSKDCGPPTVTVAPVDATYAVPLYAETITEYHPEHGNDAVIIVPVEWPRVYVALHVVPVQETTFQEYDVIPDTVLVTFALIVFDEGALGSKQTEGVTESVSDCAFEMPSPARTKNIISKEIFFMVLCFWFC